jgi:hypothetical protein
MKTISEYFDQKVWFYQPSVWKRFHELRAGETIIGTIQQKGFCGMTWIVEIQNKKWEIYKPSFWRSLIQIREDGYELPFADFIKERFRSKGMVNFPKGEKLKIAPHLFKSFCEIKTENDEVLVRIKLKTAMRDKAEVVVEKKSDLIDKNPWVLMLAYIIALEQKHQATAAHSGAY